jgi:sugar phosphate isomerase/epimerase
LSTTTFGSRLKAIEDQAFAAVAMGFRRLELGLLEAPVTLGGFEDSARETGVCVSAVVTGCLDPRAENMSGTKLGSLDSDLRERAVNSLRRHVRLAQKYKCPTVIVRGCEVEDKALRDEADKLRARIVREGIQDEVKDSVRELVGKAQKKSAKQLEHLCRSLHTVMSELPETRIAIETGDSMLDLLSFQAVGWVLDDLARHRLAYWHDCSRIQMREQKGLPTQGMWLDAYADHMVGIHLQDAADGQVDMPPGTGQVDFKLVHGYVGKNVERVLEIDARHGRAEILNAVHFLIGRGF